MPLPPQKPPGRPGAPGRPGLAPSAEEQERARRHQTDELADEAQRIEEELEALKARYEQYFLGVERREPVHQREEARKKVLRLKGAFTRNTGLRFKIQSLHARYLSYERLWQRSAREKEEGTYRRDLFKARLRARDGAGDAATTGEAAASTPEGPPSPRESGERVGVRGAAAAPATGAPTVKTPTPRSPAAPAPAAPAGDPQVRAIFEAYVAAKKRCNEDVSRITYDAVARTVAKQTPELIAKYKAKAVDFRVEIKDGKAVLKAIPRV